MFRPLCIAVLLAATLVPAFAQEDDEEPASPAPMPAARTAPPRNPITAGDMVTLQYPSSDVQDVLHLYETLTGKRLVMDNNVQGKVNIFITKPVPREEAIKIIEMNLSLNGYSLVPADENIVEVVGVGKNPRVAAVPIVSNEADIPPGDQTVSFLFKLSYADPQELAQVLTQYMSGPGSAGAILALPKSGSLLVTQNAGVIRRLARIVSQLDVAPAEVVSEFVKLERADAQKVVDMLKDIFEKGNQPGQPSLPNAVRPIRPPIVGQPQPGQVAVETEPGGMTVLSEDTLVVGKIKISADVRTNRIHVITRPSNMPFIRQLIAQFDENVEFAKPVTRPLRYVSAADMLPVITQALTEPGANQQGGTQTSTTPNLPAQQQAQQQRANGISNTASTTGDYGQTGTSGSLNVSEELSTQPVDTTPKAVTIGNSKIIADQRANTIIILGSRDVVVKVQKILDEMDVSSPQVALSTVIGELTLNNDEEFGVDYFQKFQRQSGKSNGGRGGWAATSLNNPTGSTGSVIDPAGLINFQNLAAIAGQNTNVFLNAGDVLTAVVHMLDATGRFRTISRPTVFTSNNKKAIIASGQEIPIPVNTYSAPTAVAGITTGTTFASSSSVEYKKVALQLEVVPLINSEKEVSLDILQKLDSLTGQTTNVNGNAIPTIQTRYIRTNIAAPNCSTIVLGGLIQNGNQRSTTGIPVLDKIPVIGSIFRSTVKNKNRQELVVLMRPEVTLSKLDLQRLRMKTEDKTHLGGELDQDDCPDCPPDAAEQKQGDKEIVLPAPDLPAAKFDR